MRRMAVLMTISFVTASIRSLAHEPLWGETAQTFAFGVIHPEIRFGYENDSRLFRGVSRIANPFGLRRSRFDSLLSVQYAPTTRLNLKFELPMAQVWTQQRVNGALQTSDSTGLGDAMITMKSRFQQRFGQDWKVHQAYTVGLQLPTGQRSARLPDGSSLSPSDQPGTGNLGFLLGYQFGYERLNDTVWASASWNHEVTGSTGRGDMLALDAAYGYWVKRARRPQDLGALIALGAHWETMGHDRIAGNRDPDSGYDFGGIHASLIATRGQAQFRAGVLVPVYQRANGTQLRPELQVRAGIEALL